MDTFPACGHEMTPGNTYKDGRCLTCKRDRDKANYAKRKGQAAPAPTPPASAASPHASSLTPATAGCGQVDAGWTCTAHAGGKHVAMSSGGVRMHAWPIAPAPDTTGAAAIINMSRPASSACQHDDCGLRSLSPDVASLLGNASAHEAANPGHTVLIEGYKAGSTTERASWRVSDLVAAATAAERPGVVLDGSGSVGAARLTALKETTTLTLPGGGTYRMRSLAGVADVHALRSLREANLPVLLYGPPGTGKTMMVGAAFPEHQRLDGDGDTLTDDFTGKWDPDGKGGYIWSDGPLTIAMRLGVPLFIDDATLISPKVIAIVYPIMDGRGDLILKAHTVEEEDGTRHPEVVTAKPGFYVIAGHNPGVHGAIMSEALASRFSVHIGVPTDMQLARKMGVDAKAVKIATNLAVAVSEGKIAWHPQLRELLAFQRLSDTLGYDAAMSNLAGLAPLEDRAVVMETITAVVGHEIPPLTMGAAL